MVFFRSVELTFFVNSFISCGMGSPHIIDSSDFAIRNVSFNTNKGRLSVMNLRSQGPVAGQPISVKIKYRTPFSEPIQRPVRDNHVHFKIKWRTKIQFSCILSRVSFQFSCILSRVFIVAMLQHRPLKTCSICHYQTVHYLSGMDSWVNYV